MTFAGKAVWAFFSPILPAPPLQAHVSLSRHSLEALMEQGERPSPDPRSSKFSLSQKDLLEEVMATRSSILAWRIPSTEEPGGLQSTGSQRVGHD